MPRYDFRCPGCGTTTETHPIATVPDASTCPQCAGPTTRLFSAPTLAHGSSTAMRLLDATKQTAEKPAVVTSLPGSRPTSPRPVSRDPRHATLPRP